MSCTSLGTKKHLKLFLVWQAWPLESNQTQSTAKNEQSHLSVVQHILVVKRGNQNHCCFLEIEQVQQSFDQICNSILVLCDQLYHKPDKVAYYCSNYHDQNDLHGHVHLE